MEKFLYTLHTFQTLLQLQQRPTANLPDPLDADTQPSGYLHAGEVEKIDIIDDSPLPLSQYLSGLLQLLPLLEGPILVP